MLWMGASWSRRDLFCEYQTVDGGRLSAGAVARRVVRRGLGRASRTVACAGTRNAASRPSPLPLSFHLQAGLQCSSLFILFTPLSPSAFHSAAIQSLFGGRSRRMSFFTRKKHNQQASTSVVAASPASAALAQVQQQPASQQQAQRQLSKETSYDRFVTLASFSLPPCLSRSPKCAMDSSLTPSASAASTVVVALLPQ